MFDDQANDFDETLKEKQFDATGGTSGMDMSNMMVNLEKEDKDFLNNQYDEEEEDNFDDTNIHDNYPESEEESQSTATKQIKDEYIQLEKEIRDMQKVISDQVKGEGSLDFSTEKDEQDYYDETPKKEE